MLGKSGGYLFQSLEKLQARFPEDTRYLPAGSRAPGAGTLPGLGDGIARDGAILGDVEVEHPAEREVGAVLERIGDGILRRDRAGGHDLEGDPRLGHRLHERGGLLRVAAPVAGHLGGGLDGLAGARRGGIFMVVEGLDIKIHRPFLLLDQLDGLQFVRADAAGEAEGLGVIQRAAHHGHFFLPETFVGLFAPEVDGLGAEVGDLLEVLAILGGILDVAGAIENGLDLAAVLAVIAERQHHGGRDVDGKRVDAAGLGQFDGLADLGIGVVGLDEFLDVAEVAGVLIAREQVTAEDQAREVELAELAGGQQRLLGGFGGGWRGDLGGACGTGGGQTGRGQHGVADEISAVQGLFHNHSLVSGAAARTAYRPGAAARQGGYRERGRNECPGRPPLKRTKPKPPDTRHRRYRDQFPFPVVGSGKGMYVAEGADDFNREYARPARPRPPHESGMAQREIFAAFATRRTI